MEGSIYVQHSQPSAPIGRQELGGSEQPFLVQPPCLMEGPWGPHHNHPLVLPVELSSELPEAHFL